MLTRSKVSEMQLKSLGLGGVDRSDNANFLEISFEEAIDLCQKHISKYSTQAFRHETPEVKRELTKKYINEFVDANKPQVRGYHDLLSLKNALKDEISHYGPITEVMQDPMVDEVRANGPKQIFLEIGGKTVKFNKGFMDREHMERVISKLIGVSKVRLTPKIPMVNARTMEGYRVNATHAEISPYNVPAFVIRKFSKKRISIDEMVQSKSFSKNMFGLLSLIPKADLSWLTVGSTGSGKTTLNELLIKQINPLSRVITIENPSEMRLLRHEDGNEYGEVINDVLQYESVPDDDDSSPATMENLLINAMRQSPHWIGPGELRTPGEFATALRAAQTGHYFFSTLHAGGDREAIFRFLTAYLMASNEPAELALRNICNAISFIIVQEKLADGARKVTKITEVTGSEGLEPTLNPIYEFICYDVEEEPETHKVIRIIGEHKRIGVISEGLQQKMLKAGMKKSRFEFLTKPVDKDEKEVYD